MSDYGTDVAKLDQIVGEIQRIRYRTCEPKANSNPRYLALSNAVSFLRKAADDLRRER
jgi:hypothetical protein